MDLLQYWVCGKETKKRAREWEIVEEILGLYHQTWILSLNSLHLLWFPLFSYKLLFGQPNIFYNQNALDNREPNPSEHKISIILCVTKSWTWSSNYSNDKDSHAVMMPHLSASTLMNPLFLLPAIPTSFPHRWAMNVNAEPRFSISKK